MSRRGIIVGAVATVLLCGGAYGARRASKPQTPPVSASFVGSQACSSCHTTETGEWKRPQHRAAMSVATDSTVLASFDSANVTYAGVRTEFTHYDGKFYARTDGPDGKLAEFPVQYTFGVQPLQQYLIALPGGRIQALSIAWDSRTTAEHGQRWFHLHANERVTHDDELHWTHPSQNWNFMCADCHSTALRKNYDRATDRFQTKWSEISVGCEACHGPGSAHVAWASAPPHRWTTKRDPAKGLTTRLDERQGVVWTRDATTGNALRSRPRATGREIETCAQCHSRRSQVADGYEAGKPLLDFYRPALLSRPLYHVDGQQHDEVYDWGSFLQSRMYARGVTCSDCHSPHSGKLRAEGNAVCTSCHFPAKYDAPAHLNHQAGSAGASCVGCHMPTTTYMSVDARHDHSLRVPRPDLSVAIGTPNACKSCHTTRDARWAAAKAEAWYGRPRAGEPHERMARTFAAVDAGAVDAQARLRALATEGTQPAIVRASAFAEWTSVNDGDALDALAAGLRDSNDLVRFGALQAVGVLSPEVRLRLAPPMLSDPRRVIRMDAARVLADVATQGLDTTQRAAFEHAAIEFAESQRYNADRPEARVNLGTFRAQLGDAAGAEAELLSAIRLEPAAIPAYVNLADVYREQGRDEDAERVLRAGLTKAPKNGALHYALGLALTRLHRGDVALREFEQAAALEPANARYAYVRAVALNSAGRSDASIAALEVALRQHPSDPDILSALAKYLGARGKYVEAARYRERLQVLGQGR